MLILSCVSCTEVFGDDTVDDMLTAWIVRQNRIRSAHFTWSSRNDYSAGGLLPADISDSGEAVPKESFSYVDPAVSIWIDGMKFRYEHEQTDYELRMAGQKVRRYTSVYDGDVSADFTSPEETYQPYPIGIIHKELEYNDIGNVRLWPLLLWCRPLHPALLDPEGLEVMKGVVRVQENVNIVLVTVSRTDNTIAQLWVDPAAGYTIKRYTALNDGKPTVVINITYTNDPVHGWIPAEWNTRMLKQDGSSVVSVGAKVTSIAINNRIPVETFRLVFPPNSRVGDFRAMEDYVVSDDGSKRVITKEELEAGFTINELKAKKPGETLRAHDPSWRYPLLWLNLLVIGIIVLWMVFRSYRHRL